MDLVYLSIGATYRMDLAHPYIGSSLNSVLPIRLLLQTSRGRKTYSIPGPPQVTVFIRSTSEVALSDLSREGMGGSDEELWIDRDETETISLNCKE